MVASDALPRASQLLREGQPDAAEPVLRALLHEAPDNAEALHLLGIVEGQRGRFETALRLLERAAALQPRDVALQNNLGNALAGANRDAEAVDAFDRALARDPAHAKAWCNRGRALRRIGRLLDAVDSFERALMLDAGFVDALVGKADALEAMHRRGEAIAALQAAIAAGGDEPSLRYSLATLGAAALPSAAPQDFVRTLFDHYAGHFDAHLVGTLQYRAPALIDAALDAVPAGRGLDIVDLGCGTGLCGPLLKPRAKRLVGVDLSRGMLEKARRREVYDELVDAEIVAWLADHTAAWDLAAAADVVIYLGDLAPLFAAAAKALRPGGIFVFTVEDWAGDGFGLKASGRYGHSGAYLRTLAGQYRFGIVAADTVVLRQDGGQQVDGHLLVLRRPLR